LPIGFGHCPCYFGQFGFIMGFARVGMDGLHKWIPFNTAHTVHLNTLVVWLLAGFMGAAYYIIPEEAETELWKPKWAYAQLVALTIVRSCRLNRLSF